MFIRDLKDCEQFLAGDHTQLRELLHPDKADLRLGYSLAHATLGPGRASTPHTLQGSEVYYILEGEGRMQIDGETATVSPGQAVYIPPHARQHIENTGRKDLKFLCLVDPAWRRESEEVH